MNEEGRVVIEMRVSYTMEAKKIHRNWNGNGKAQYSHKIYNIF